MKTPRMILLGTAATAAVVVGAAPAAASPHTGSGPTAPVVVVSGLNNPRQLSLAGDRLFIAEAGKGGSVEVAGPDGPTYVGTSGSISAVWHPNRVHGTAPNRVVTGLVSGAGADGSFATGPDGVSVRRSDGPIYIQETYVPPDVLSEPLDAVQSGKLLKARAYRPGLSVVADITAYERAHDPDGKGFDSNPYAVLATRRGQYVADAAGNDVLFVDRRGRISTFHVFPNVTTGACATQADPDPAHPGCNFVPTSLAQDRRGHLYVGGLSSLTPGEAQVVELSRRGSVLKVWTGFTAVTGVAVGRDGSLYVSQLFAPQANPPSPQVQGVLTKVSRHGTRTNVDVPFPAGVVTNGRGTVYVSAWSGSPEGGLAGPGTSGQVWRLRF